MIPTNDELQAEDLAIVGRCVREPHGEEAWRAFLARFVHFIERTIQQSARIANPQDREDLLQGILLQLAVLNGLSGYDPSRAPFRVYLRVVVRNAVRDRYRQAMPETPTPEDELSLAADARQVAEQFLPIQEDELQALILKHLNETIIDLSKLRVFCDIVREVPIPELIERHGISQATAYRYRMECLRLAYAALGTVQPSRRPKKKE